MSFSAQQPVIGYTRREFGTIFQIYSRNVYNGFFRDFGFAEVGGRYYISFREEAGKTPLFTVEKRKLGPDRNLFVATTTGADGQPFECVRSEKIDIFCDRLAVEVDRMRDRRLRARGLRVVAQ